MKRGVLFCCVAALSLLFLSCTKEDVPDLEKVEDVCEVIDDYQFEKYVIENFDTDKNGKLSMSEAAAATIMYLEERNIKSLSGIEYFTNLSVLKCYQNQLTSLDLSKNIKLTQLQCTYNKLTSLDVSKNVRLKELYCYDNYDLTTLTLGDNSSLEVLNCAETDLDKLNVSKNVNLSKLDVFNTGLTELDVTKNINLVKLNCGNTDYGDNSHVKRLAKLDVSKNVKLEMLYCNNNLLTELNVSRNLNLVELECWVNPLVTVYLNKKHKNVLKSGIPEGAKIEYLD